MILSSKIPIEKFNTFIMSLLIIGTITGSSIYFGFQEIQFFRIILVVSTLTVILMIKKYRTSLSEPSILILIFFTIYFLWTTTISIFTDSIRINDLLNFSIMYLLVVVIIFFMNYNNEAFLKVYYKTSVGMSILMFVISIWEIRTHHHFSASSSNDAPSHLTFLPTAFFTNTNDMMAILTLIILYIIGYFSVYKKPLNLFIYFLLITTIILSFITSARLAMLILLFTFLLLFLQKINFKKILIGGFIILLGLIILINFINLDSLLPTLSIGGESTSLRMHLYIDAFDSIEMYNGLGAGINNSHEFYQILNDQRLNGLINPHNYLIEILINSGVLVFFLYYLLNLYLFILFLKQKQYFLIFMLLVYQIILLASSSSLFLWFHYVYFISLSGLYTVSLTINNTIKKT